jgi:hypothetical protein
MATKKSLPSMRWMLARIDRQMLRVLLSIEQEESKLAAGVSLHKLITATRWELIEMSDRGPYRMTLRGDQLLRNLRNLADYSILIDNILTAHRAKKAN